MSRVLFLAYGVENCYIELLETYPCASKEALKSREQHFIRTHDCVNKNSAIIAEEDKETYMADYNSKYRASHKEYFAEYRVKNKDQIAEKNAKYHAAHCEERKIYNRKYRAWKSISKEFRSILMDF